MRSSTWTRSSLEGDRNRTTRSPPSSWIDSTAESYANVARITLDSINAYADDVRSSRQIKGGIKIKSAP